MLCDKFFDLISCVACKGLGSLFDADDAVRREHAVHCVVWAIVDDLTVLLNVELAIVAHGHEGLLSKLHLQLAHLNRIRQLLGGVWRLC